MARPVRPLPSCHVPGPSSCSGSIPREYHTNRTTSPQDHVGEPPILITDVREQSIRARRSESVARPQATDWLFGATALSHWWRGIYQHKEKQMSYRNTVCAIAVAILALSSAANAETFRFDTAPFGGTNVLNT